MHHVKSTSDKSLSDFEATLAMLPPRLAARLSLDPSRDSSPQVIALPVHALLLHCTMRGGIGICNMLKLPLSGAGKQPAQHALRARVRNQLPQWRKPRALQRQHFTASSPQRQRQVLPHLIFSALQIPLDTTQPGCQCHSTMQQRQAS